MAVKSKKSSNFSRLLGITLVGLIVATTDLLIWRAAIGGLAFAVACMIIALAALVRHRLGWAMTAVRWFSVGICTALLSFGFGFAVDQANEHTARQLAAKVAAYKAERGIYPPQDVGNGWADALLGYTQRYTLTGENEARVWFTRFNYRLQSISVATKQLESEQNQ